MALPVWRSAIARSYCAWRFSQNCGSVPNQWPKRRAVSPVIERLPAMIWLMRFGGTQMWRAVQSKWRKIGYRVHPSEVTTPRGRYLNREATDAKKLETSTWILHMVRKALPVATLEGEYVTYKLLWAVAQHQVEHSEQQPRGSDFDRIAAMIFAFFALEAYLNFILEKLAPDVWKAERSYFRGAGFLGKLKKVSQLAKMPAPDFGSDPYGTIRLLEKFRNDMVHAHTEKLEPRRVKIPNDHEPTIRSKLDVVVTPEQCGNAMRQVEQVIKEIHKAARLRRTAGWRHPDSDERDTWFLSVDPLDGVFLHASGPTTATR
jgi:hypothetical protein